MDLKTEYNFHYRYTGQSSTKKGGYRGPAKGIGAIEKADTHFCSIFCRLENGKTYFLYSIMYRFSLCRHLYVGDGY